MFSDRIWSQMQFTIKWSLVSLVFSKMPGSEWLHSRSFFFSHEDHDFLICFDARIYCRLDRRMCSSTSAAEMPTSGDLKSGDCLFFTTPPPGISTTGPPKNWPSPQWEWLRTLYDVLHDVHTIKIRNHHFDARNNLCPWQNTYKNAPETVLRIRKLNVLS